MPAKHRKTVTIPVTPPCCWCRRPARIRLCRAPVLPPVPLRTWKRAVATENPQIPFPGLRQSTRAVVPPEPYLRCANALAPVQGSHSTAGAPLPSLLPGKPCRALCPLSDACCLSLLQPGAATRRCARYAAACRLAVEMLWVVGFVSFFFSWIKGAA